MKKKATKRTARKASASGLPSGYQAIGGFTPFWEPAKGDVLEGVFGDRRTIKRKNVRKGQNKMMTLATITQDNGEAFTVSESAMLRPLFEKAEDGDRVYLRFDGMGKKKPGQNAPRLYTIGLNSE